ncbi:hypothetical protein BGAL_0192g00010 [Botrytis galanthina]|uniref:Uncharacterized protein n=1 Tax=Botrytis galanthina TaxID=278940 RepID=A0A4S8R8A8_9HELO|nr:hypothetical protein BGAL_0192g00010 [Botrytis galanthina]
MQWWTYMHDTWEYRIRNETISKPTKAQAQAQANPQEKKKKKYHTENPTYIQCTYMHHLDQQP